jgi:hypothetical protein
MEETARPWNGSLILQYSKDLNAWNRFGGRQTLVFPGQTESQTNRNSVNLPGQDAPYVLLSMDKNTPALRKVTAVFNTLTRPETLRETVFPGTKSGDSFSVSYNTEGCFPGAALDFLLPGADSINVEILCRNSEEDPWQFWDEGTIFRIGAGPDLRKNKPWTGKTSYPFWKINSRGGIPFASVPGLLLTWEPYSIVFLARGKGPWILAYGNRDAAPAGNLPRQFQDQETQPAVITGSEIRQTRPAKEPAWKQWILWASLILAVAALSAMAYYMAKSMRKQN